jgi:hypothetical protein
MSNLEVHKAHDYVANEVSLSVLQEYLWSLPPNGKSLIRIINQITLPDSGVILDGENYNLNMFSTLAIFQKRIVQ